MKLPTISFCLISKNEEKNIKECIEKVKPAVDEIIVLDTGSTDNTVKIAEELGAKIGHFDWDDDFSEARNTAIEMATKDWILFLDCDERLEAEDLALLKKTIANYGEEYVAVQQPINSVTDGGGITSYRVTLFKRDPRIRYRGRVHETVSDSINEFKGKFLKVDIPVIHLGYRDKNSLIDKAINRNYKILKEEHEKDPNNVGVTIYLAKTELSVLNNPQNAKKYLEEVLPRENDMSVPQKTEMHFLLGYVNYLLKDEEKMLGHWGKVLELDPKFPDVYWVCGRYFYDEKQFGTALAFFEQTIRTNGHFAQSQVVNFSYRRKDLYTFLEECAAKTGEFVKSIAWKYKEKQEEKKKNEQKISS